MLHDICSGESMLRWEWHTYFKKEGELMKLPDNCLECPLKVFNEENNEYYCPFDEEIPLLNIGRLKTCPLLVDGRGIVYALNYSITWNHIVKEMKNQYGIDPDSKDLYSMGSLEDRVENIWSEWYDKLHPIEARIEDERKRSVN